jgi:hypothetical protein
VAHPVHEFAQAGPGLGGQGVAGMPQVVEVDADEPGRFERRAPDAREVAAAELGTFRPMKTRLWGSAPVKSSRCSATSASRKGGMVTQRILASDLGGPVTSAPVVSSTTAASTRIRPAETSMCLRRSAASSPQRRPQKTARRMSSRYRRSANASARSKTDPERTPQQNHQGWYNRLIADGWQHRPVKDEAEKTHPDLVLFDQLPEHEKQKDRLFLAIVRALTPEDLTLLFLSTSLHSTVAVCGSRGSTSRIRSLV